MSHTTQDAPRVRSRRHLAVRLAVPAALAAALAATVLTVNHVTAGPASPAPAAGRASADDSPVHISTAAYTLSRKPGHVVTVVFLKGSTPMPAQLRNDLERVGVKAEVYTASRTCDAHYTGLPDYEPSGVFLEAVRGQRRDGVSTATIRLDRIPAGDTLEVTYVPVVDHSYVVHFALNKATSPESDCIRAGGVPVHKIEPNRIP
ncbi:hypothetical protein [Actinacidiphila acidipaludis]|uniref:Tat pathway signal sequence domain protein n=1 Tax=Actinacidiphila acidipaludis TaxID=2873382 RepID=A0ABS7QIG3_9ACTN|nr:hypothetical protein [Streptomyces acidipaludis]MBY8882586.1 hypothetical protein [Streptomyces acidipaludis]